MLTGRACMSLDWDCESGVHQQCKVHVKAGGNRVITVPLHLLTLQESQRDTRHLYHFILFWSCLMFKHFIFKGIQPIIVLSGKTTSFGIYVYIMHLY